MSILKRLAYWVFMVTCNIHVPVFIVNTYFNAYAFEYEVLRKSISSFLVTLVVALVTTILGIVHTVLFFFAYTYYKWFRRVTLLIFAPYFIFVSDLFIYWLSSVLVGKQYLGLIVAFSLVSMMLNFYFVFTNIGRINSINNNAKQFCKSRLKAFCIILPSIKWLILQSVFSTFTLAFDEIVCYRIFDELDTINSVYQNIVTPAEKYVFTALCFIMTFVCNVLFISLLNHLMNKAITIIINKNLKSEKLV